MCWVPLPPPWWDPTPYVPFVIPDKHSLNLFSPHCQLGLDWISGPPLRSIPFWAHTFFYFSFYSFYSFYSFILWLGFAFATYLGLYLLTPSTNIGALILVCLFTILSMSTLCSHFYFLFYISSKLNYVGDVHAMNTTRTTRLEPTSICLDIYIVSTHTFLKITLNFPISCIAKTNKTHKEILLYILELISKY